MMEHLAAANGILPWLMTTQEAANGDVAGKGWDEDTVSGLMSLLSLAVFFFDAYPSLVPTLPQDVV